MDLANIMLFLAIFWVDFDYLGISAQVVEVTSPSSMIWKERAEVTCTFSGTLISIEWKTTEEKASDSDGGDQLLYISNGEVKGPGKSRGMDISLSNYSLIINNVMLQDSGTYFWCKVTIGSVGVRENSSSSIVYNEVEPFITATECGAGNDADFCVTAGEPITCKVFGLKPLNEDDIELTIYGDGKQGSQSQEQYEVIEDGVSYTFYNVERTLNTGSAAAEAYTYNCKIKTSAFEADAPPVKVLVSKVTTPTKNVGAIVGGVFGGIVVIGGVVGGVVYVCVYKEKN